MAVKLFEVYGEALLKGKDQMQKDLGDIDKSGEKTGSSFGQSMGKIVKATAAVGAAMIGAGVAVTKLATNMAKKGDEIDKMSQKIGISRTAYQEWGYVLSQNGADVSILQTGIKTLTNAAAEATKGTGKYADAFGKLGISVTDTSGKLKSQEQIFNETMNALTAMENETERAALANELFGRSATELAPVLNAGAGSVENLKNKAHELGIILGDEAVDASVELTDTLDTMKRTMEVGLMKAMQGVMPVVQKLFDLFIKHAGPIFDALSPVFELLIGAFATLMDELLPPIIELFGEILNQILPPLVEIFVKVFESLSPILKVIMDLVSKTVLPLFNELLTALSPIIGAVFDLLGPLLDALTPVFDLFAELAQIIMPALNPLLEALKPILNALKPIIEVIGIVLKPIADLLSKIVSAVKWIIENIGEIATAFTPGGSYLGGIIKGETAKMQDKARSAQKMPYMAEGGSVGYTGQYIVGEEGPEMVTLPKGAYVHTASETAAMSNQTFNIFNNNNPSPYEVFRSAKKQSQLVALGV